MERSIARGGLRPVCAAVVVFAFAASAAPDADGSAAAGPRLVVGSAAAFASAVERLRHTGGTIVLRPGRYERLAIGARGAARLDIRAARGASAGTVELIHTRAVHLRGLRVTPRGAPASLRVHESHDVTLDGVVVTGRGSRQPAGIDLERSAGVVIRRSSFSHCGDGHVCLLLGLSDRVELAGNRFYDCRGCDFVRGRAGHGLTIRENRFHRALVGRCGANPRRCNHQEMIELHTGRNVVIERNVFGVYQLPGAAQIALFGPLADVRIRNNVFRASDPKAPGVRAHVAINLGGLEGLPKRVVIANNTILAGRKRADRRWATSIRIKTTFASVARADRPVVANNVIRLAETRRLACAMTRLAVRNAIVTGKPCSETDTVGDPRLDRFGRPTAASTILRDRAAPAWAPPVDFTGAKRGSAPDIGAYELRRAG